MTLLFFLLLFPRMEGMANPLPPRILDLHAHVACLGRGERQDGECYISSAMRRSFKFPIYLKSFGVTRREMKESNDLVVFERLVEKIKSSTRLKGAVVLAMDAAIDRASGHIDWDGTQVYVPNEFVLPGIRKYPGILYFGASINPYRKDALQRLVKAKSDGAVLIKWIPSTMNIDPSDPVLKPFYEKMVELHLPLLVHTGHEESFIGAQQELCDPMRLKFPLDLGVKVITAHVASSGKTDGQSDFDRLRELFQVEKYKGLLFSEISATTQFNRIRNLRQWVQDPLFHGRLIYGSDWPLIEVKVLGISIVPYKLYATFLYGNILRPADVAELDSISSSLDRDVRLKELLNVPPGAFQLGEKILGL